MNKTILKSKGIGLLLLAAVSVLGLGQAPAEDEKAKPRILLIGKDPDHPWGTHMYLPTCVMLTKCLRQIDGVETVVSAGWPKDPNDLVGVKTIVVYTSPAAELLLDGPHAKDFEKLMDQGIGLVTVHWASSVFQENLERIGDKWMGYLGGTWISNVGLSIDTAKLKQLLPEHPICRGWSEYELHDEFYLDPKIAQGKPLLQVTTKGKDVTVGWVHEREDGGRAFGTTLGHFYSNFQIDAFRQMIVNGVLWTAHVDIPEAGAPIRLSEEQLALPEQPKNE
jgi:type 1 glutamine amidotransferase